MDEVDVADAVIAAEAQRNEELRRTELMRTIDFGLAVQQFLDGKIGQKILADAEAELKELTHEMYDLNIGIPSGNERMIECLARARVLLYWQNQFGEYIIAGRNAEKEMENDE